MPTPPSSPSFTLFPHLPPELRLQIYHHACHPRVTTLIYREDTGNTTGTGTGTFHCPTHPPTLLHISRESRAEGRRLYVQCFLPPPPNPFCPPEREPEGQEEEKDDEKRYFYHHPQLDTLYLPRPNPNRTNTNNHFGFGFGGMGMGMGYASWACAFATTLLPDVARVVRRLAVDYVPGEVRRPWEVYGKVCLLRGCARLEEAFLVVGGCPRGQQTRGRTQAGHGGGGGGGGRNGEGEGEGDLGEREREGAEVEFVDPRADDGEIVGIMERVRESFRVELGGGGGLGMGMGKEGMKEDGEDGVAGLELIPKAKVVSAWGCRPVVCAS